MQQQANGVSVQSSLQDSVFKLSGEKVVVYGAGRTDAGVHAYGQVASFAISTPVIKSLDFSETTRAAAEFNKTESL